MPLVCSKTRFNYKVVGIASWDDLSIHPKKRLWKGAQLVVDGFEAEVVGSSLSCLPFSTVMGAGLPQGSAVPTGRVH